MYTQKFNLILFLCRIVHCMSIIGVSIVGLKAQLVLALIAYGRVVSGGWCVGGMLLENVFSLVCVV